MGGATQHYLRFVLPSSDPDSGVPEGPFAAAYRLRDDPETPAFDREQLAELLTWFDDNVEAPTRFNRTNSKARFHRAAKGISWMKAHAHAHIGKMRDIAVILGEHGYQVRQLGTDRPGYIVYEDAHQIVAEPFADTPTSR